MSKENRNHQDHLQFLKSLDEINAAIQGTSDLQQMMGNVLDTVLSVFDCDRAFLLFPCDPEASSWSSPMERTKAEYPGVHILNLEVPMNTEVAQTLRVLLDSDGPVNFGPQSEHKLPPDVAEQFNIKAYIGMAIYPKLGKPWQFGIHQCSHARIWTRNEKQLFKVVGQRIADSLSALLSYHELSENREFLENIVENIPDMVFVKDAQALRFIRLNKAGEKLLGYSQQELIGKNDYDFFTKEEADFFTSKDREVLDRKELVDIPGETIHTKYGKKFLHTKKIPLCDKTGHPTYLLGISQDITKRQLAETRLQESEERFRILVDHAADAFFLHDEGGEILDVNFQACESLGYSRDELIGMKPNDFDAGQAPSFIDQMEARLSVGEMIEFETRHRRKDGSVFPVEVRCRPLRQGERNLAVSLARDITDRKSVEEKLRNLSHAIEQSPVSIVITDLEGKIEFVNTTFTQITGYTYAETLGQHTRILKSGETPVEKYCQLWKTISSGGVWQGEFLNRKKNGDLFWEHATIAPVKDTDNVISKYVAVKEDITERKKLDEQLRQSQKMEAVGQLAGGVAHDFNNMLGVIMGYAELALNKTNKDNPLRKNLEQIKKAGHRSTEITRQLLAFARKQTIKPEILDLNKTIKGMLKLIGRLIGENIDLVLLPGKNVWPIRIDPSQVDQIMANLCVNAKDAISGVGKITIETQNVKFDETYCSNHKGFSPGEYVMVAVSDTGHGMDKQILDKIFEPFFTTKEVGKGTGLGLSTVYGIVKQNSGFINVYSELGYGSTFKIYLPHHRLETRPMQVENPKSFIVRGSETILLVEDDSILLNMAQEMLENFGYSVLSSSTPEEAITIVNKNTYKIKLLLTDVIMPEMTGRDLEKKLTALLPELKCLFMSGYTGKVIADLGVSDEDINFIQKPFSIHQLAAKVREVLDSR